MIDRLIFASWLLQWQADIMRQLESIENDPSLPFVTYFYYHNLLEAKFEVLSRILARLSVNDYTQEATHDSQVL